MNLIYIIDYRFARTPDGVIWTDTAYDRAFWEPCLQVFDKVTLLSRVRDVPESNSSWLPVSSERVVVEALPHYLGPREFLKQSAQIRLRMREILDQPGAVILRVPSQLSSVAAGELRKMKKDYAVEVVGDANAAFAPDVVRVPGRAAMRYWFTRSQERVCGDATAAAYVAKCLQARYPSRLDREMMVCSDVRLDEAWMRNDARDFKHPGRHIVTVATLSQTYKGIDVLLRALAECRLKGHPFRLTIIGHGKYQSSLERLAEELVIDNCVRFAGCLPWGSNLREELDNADLFVLPSRVEALPRALLEAMSRALPALATRVGAVPELLPSDQLITPGSVLELAEQLIKTCNSPERLTSMSRLSINMARCYSWRSLHPRWLEFYGRLADRAATQQAKARCPKILLLTTSAPALWVFFRDQAKFLREEGFDVSAVCSPGPELARFEEYSGCKVFPLEMERSISPFRDAAATLRLIRIVRDLRPDIVHTHTPKAGILGMLAGAFAGCRVRLHTYHGLRSETLRGPKRMLVETIERWTGNLSTRCFAVSSSLRDLLLVRRICGERKLHVLGYGGCAGIDLRVFDPVRRRDAGRAYRRCLGIPESAIVVAYVGRIAREKGLGVLVEAWKAVEARMPHARLIACGPLDGTDPLPAETMNVLESTASIVFRPFLHTDVTEILAAADIVVLPSFREGLGVAALEASAMQLPVIASNVTGLKDAVVHGVTGLLVAPNNYTELANAIQILTTSSELRSRMGKAGRKFIAQRFSHDRVFNLLQAEYRRVLEVLETPRRSINVKRIFDLAIAIPALIVTLPLMAMTGMLICLILGCPALFRQRRAGLDGKSFTLFKLRTMSDERDSAGNLLPDHERLSRFGRFLRAASIDELPQLWNVVRGDMSLVGPRPLLERYLPRYSELQRRRHLVLPGITGWAQVHGRNALSWQEKFSLDVWYVNNRSLALDLRILWQTALKLFARNDISAPDHCTMPEFLGNSGNRATLEATAVTVN